MPKEDRKYFSGQEWLNRSYELILLSCIQFKLHFHNHAGTLPWYYGIAVRFRVMFFNHFKIHLVFLIGKYASKY